MNSNERFEYMAAKFYKETGMMSPGKDDCLMSHDYDERIKKWSEWLELFYADMFDNNSKDKWISVEDELPEEIGRYWCYLEEQNDLGKSHYQWNCGFNGDVFSPDVGSKVTHWQPLPTPPLNYDR